ncbi:MAG: EAL domain-containing protein [Maricaulaceae bacterium]|jgi:diguanylate cyclase (GGDEF)-like protein
MSARTVRISIATKAVAILCVVLGASIATLAILELRADVRQRVEESLERINSTVKTVSEVAGPRIDDRPYLETLVEALTAFDSVHYAAIISANGRPVAWRASDGSSTEGAIGLEGVDALAARAWAEGVRAEELTSTSYHIAEPIYADGRIIAVLRIGLARNGQQVVGEITERTVALGLVAFGIIAPITGLAIAFILRPIRQLTTVAEKIARRDFDFELNIKSRDELQVLGESLNDMSRQVRESIARIRQLAFVDELTRLPNKTGFYEHARRLLTRSDLPSAALLIDLDKFKRLNDIYGNREGDQLLAAAARRMQAAVKRMAEQFRHPDAPPPLLARLSGDEYAVLICGPSPTRAAKEAAEELLGALREPFALNESEALMSASIGIARAPNDGREIEELLRLANLALDAVKASGGNGYRFFEPEMTQRAVAKITLENELRTAITNREFELHYQPKVSARTGEVSGCEALVRWRRAGKLVGPGAFIPAAEDCGLIAPIGDWVLEEACSAGVRWMKRGARCPVAVNVSAIQFEMGGFPARVLQVLKNTGLPPELLELELTETVAMRNPDEVTKLVEPLRKTGVRFAIDDFGTGHSSLASLTRMPFDTFKIDQSFVRQMETDTSARVVVETILAMARALGYDTVAEGVETPTQFAFLRLNNCTTVQGWYFGKPAPEADFLARLLSSRRDAADQDSTAPSAQSA